MLITSNLADTDVNSSVSPELFTVFSSLNRLLNNPTVLNLNISVSYKNGKEREREKDREKEGEREGKKEERDLTTCRQQGAYLYKHLFRKKSFKIHLEF